MVCDIQNRFFPRPSGARRCIKKGGRAALLGICAALLFAACLPPLGFRPKLLEGVFNFQGTFSEHPADPKEGDSYFNHVDGNTYYFNGKSWEIMSMGNSGLEPVFLPKLDAAVAAATPWSISHTGTWTDAQGNPQTGPVTRTGYEITVDSIDLSNQTWAEQVFVYLSEQISARAAADPSMPANWVLSVRFTGNCGWSLGFIRLKAAYKARFLALEFPPSTKRFISYDDAGGSSYNPVTGFSELRKLTAHGLTSVPASLCTRPIATVSTTADKIEEVHFANATVIEELAFFDCDNLRIVDIPRAAVIGRSAFWKADGLDSNNLYFPNVAEIQSGAFKECQGLYSISAANFPQLTALGAESFAGCNNLASVSLPVTSLGAMAFMNCTALTSVYFPEITEINSAGTFYGAGIAALTGASFPRLQVISGYGAFAACGALSQITLPLLTAITGEQAFANTTSLTSLSRAGLPVLNAIGKEVFSNSALQTFTFATGNITFGEGVFWNCASLDTVDLAQTTSLGQQMFKDCTNLTTLTAPAVISIGEAAFLGSGLQSVSLPLATAIGDSAFLDCSSLAQAHLPSAATIGRFAFATDGEYYGTPTLTLKFGAAAPAVTDTDGVFGAEADAVITVLVPTTATLNYSTPWQNAMFGSGSYKANTVSWSIQTY